MLEPGVHIHAGGLTISRGGVDEGCVTRRRRWAALPGLLVLPLALFVGLLLLLGPILPGMAPVVAALAALGALAILTVTVHEWTRSLVLAALAAAASVVVSVVGMLCLLFWAATHTTLG